MYQYKLYMFFVFAPFFFSSCEEGTITMPCQPKNWYQDLDGDGIGDAKIIKSACNQPDGYVKTSGVNPPLNNFNNSNNSNNRSQPTNNRTICIEKIFYKDADRDGLGDADISVQTCEKPDGFVENKDDTDDAVTPPVAFTFAIVGDLGRPGDTQERIANQIKSWNPAFIMTLGDNDYSTDGVEYNGVDRGVGRYFHEYIYNYHKEDGSSPGKHGEGSDTWRFFPTIGDHDGGDWDFPIDLKHYFNFFSIANQTLPGGFKSGHGRYYQFRWENVHFFVLNTWRMNRGEGGIAEPDGTDRDSIQAKWLATQAAASDATFKIVISHWPAYGSNKHWKGGSSDHLRNWDWKAMGLDVMFAGNDHGYERVELPKGYVYDGVDNGEFVCITSAGGGGYLYKHIDPPHEGSKIRDSSFGASRIRVNGRTLVQEYVYPDGSVVDTWTLAK